MVGNKSKVVLIGITTVVFTVMIVLLGSAYIYPMWMERTSPEACATVTPQNAMDLVTRDFMENRLPNWSNDKDSLGTQVPSLAFISEKVTADQGTYHVPFTAQGPDGKLRYIGNLNCSNKYIKYDTVD